MIIVEKRLDDRRTEQLFRYRIVILFNKVKIIFLYIREWFYLNTLCYIKINRIDFMVMAM